MTRVKICGITTTDDLRAVVAAGADAIGLTVDVDVDTPREITPQRAETLAAATPPFVTTVLVTMPKTVAEAIELVERIDPDAVQIHGTLTVEELSTLSESVRAAVLPAVEAEAASRYESVADALLVDSLDEAGAGGTGETTDWERTRAAVDALTTPVVLAGGLTPENVADAVAVVEPFAVDVASGVESDPGRKDHEAVSAFVRAAGGRP